MAKRGRGPEIEAVYTPAWGDIGIVSAQWWDSTRLCWQSARAVVYQGDILPWEMARLRGCSLEILDAMVAAIALEEYME